MSQNQNERNNGLYPGGASNALPAGSFVAVYVFPFEGCWTQYQASGGRDG